MAGSDKYAGSANWPTLPPPGTPDFNIDGIPRLEEILHRLTRPAAPRPNIEMGGRGGDRGAVAREPFSGAVGTLAGVVQNFSHPPLRIPISHALGNVFTHFAMCSGYPPGRVI